MNDFSFTNKLLLERRAATLSAREDHLEQRLTQMWSRKLTDKQLGRIERYEARLDRIRTRLADTEDQLTNFSSTEVVDPADPAAPVVDPYVADEYSFEVGRFNRRASGGTFTVKDSLTDSTYVVGDELSVQVVGEKPRASRTFSFNTLSGEVNGDTVTFAFKDSIISNMAAEFDSLTFKTVDQEGNTIFSDTVDVTNIG